MRKALIVLCAIALLGINSNQAVTRGYFFSNIGAGFSWSGSAQAGWSSSIQAATCSDYTTFIRNDGTACTPSTALVQFGFATAHAVNNTIHSPIVANNAFGSGVLSPWTSTNTGGCTGALFSISSSGDENGDGYAAQASSLGCTATAAVVTLAQSFTTGGLPTTQTYSLWYKAPRATSGDPANCSQVVGTATLAVQVNSTTIATTALTTDGLWHQLTGSLSALVSGANTMTLTATMNGARGSYQKYNPKLQDYVCTNVASATAQSVQVDNVVLSGIW